MADFLMSGVSPIPQPALITDFVRSSSEEESSETSGVMVLRNSPGAAGTSPSVQYQEIPSPVYRLDPTIDLTGAHLSHLFMDSLNQRVLKCITNTQMELATYCR